MTQTETLNPRELITEVRRLARDKAKQIIRESGLKISSVSKLDLHWKTEELWARNYDKYNDVARRIIELRSSL